MNDLVLFPAKGRRRRKRVRWLFITRRNLILGLVFAVAIALACVLSVTAGDFITDVVDFFHNGG